MLNRFVWTMGVISLAFMAVACGGKQSKSDKPAGETATAPANDPGKAWLRFVHAAVAGEVDVFVDDKEVLSDIGPGTFNSERVEVVAGEHDFQLSPGHGGDAIFTTKVTFEKDSRDSVILVGKLTAVVRGEMIGAIVTKDPMDAPADGASAFRFVHAVTGGPALNVLDASGRGFGAGVEYKSVTDYVNGPAEPTEIRLQAGTENFFAGSVPFAPGWLYTVIAMPEGDGVKFTIVNERPN